MQDADRTTAAEFEVGELHARVRLLAAKRANLAWKALLDQVHARSAAVAETLLAACRPPALRRVVADACPPVATHPWDEGCVEALAVQLVAATVGRHIRETTAEVDAPTASELFGAAELRRHRGEVRRLFQAVKGELWTSAIRAALLEAGALVVRAEARCSQSQIEALRRQLAKVLERTPSPFGVPGAELHEVAEHVALEKVVAMLGQRHRRAPARARDDSSARADVSPTGFELVLPV
jgi:hypothetical protein